MDSVASPSDSLERAHAHAINTRPSFLPRGAGSEARANHRKQEASCVNNTGCWGNHSILGG